MSTIGESIRVPEVRGTASPWPRGWLLRRALVAADIYGLVLAFAITEGMYGDIAGREAFGRSAETGLFALTLPIWIVLARLYGLYDRDETRTDQRTFDDLPGVFHLTTVGTWLVFVGSHLAGVADPDIARVTFFWIVAVMSVVASRAVARTICRRHASYVQNTIIVGADRIGKLIARQLEQSPESGLRLVGFVDSTPGEPVAGLDDVHVIGTLDDLSRLVRERDIGRVIVGFGQYGHEALAGEMRDLNDRGVQIDFVPRFYELVGPGVDIHLAGGLPLISLRPFRLSRSSLVIKRCVDFTIAGLGLFLLAPAFAVIAALIKLDSRGPVFFRQCRIGNGEFRIWKFRTMVADAEQRKHEVAHLNLHDADGRDGRMFKIENDPRVTRVGRFLRRFSLDELPQLLNVVGGDMSLVGPRPLIPEEHRWVTAWQRRRLDLKPGITGLWQVNGRSNVPFDEMVVLDYRYVTNWSLWLDLGLILKTFPKVVHGSGGAH